MTHILIKHIVFTARNHKDLSASGSNNCCVKNIEKSYNCHSEAGYIHVRICKSKYSLSSKKQTLIQCTNQSVCIYRSSIYTYKQRRGVSVLAYVRAHACVRDKYLFAYMCGIHNNTNCHPRGPYT